MKGFLLSCMMPYWSDTDFFYCIDFFFTEWLPEGMLQLWKSIEINDYDLIIYWMKEQKKMKKMLK